MARGPVLHETEILPEIDRLEHAPSPRATEALFGQERAEKTLIDLHRSGRMHHGWLFSGPEGIGKATLAYRFARYVLAAPSERDPFGQSLSVAKETTAARQVLALSHPGLLVIRRPWNTKDKRFTASIPVDEVRRLRSFVTHTAEADAYRVVIVDTADDLNPSAANALLKSLEEPPARTFFILVTSALGRLLPTIRSRCRVLEMAPLGDADLKRAALKALEAEEREAPEPSEWLRLIALSDGSVRRLLSLWNGKGLELQERIEKSLAGLPRLDWGAIHALGDELGSTAADVRFELFFELLLQHLSRMVRAGAGIGEVSATGSAARPTVPEARLASWAELWETVVREKGDTVALNLDRKALILDTFRRIETVSRG